MFILFIALVAFFVGARFGGFAGIGLGLLLLYLFKDNLDAGIGKSNEKINSKFIENIFGLFGNMAKAKGIVEKADLQGALNLMRSMRISAEYENLAKSSFNKGKKSNFDFDTSVIDLKNLFETKQEVLQMVLEILISVALIDGHMHANEKKLLQRATKLLGFDENFLEILIRRFKNEQTNQSNYAFEENFSEESKKSVLDMAYETLELNKTATEAEVRKQYKRMISKNHPDKFIAKKMPQKLIDMAKEKTQRINESYNFICKYKSWNC